jgi:1-acyl-sn-glycerol-3-phosphate acyltransferase
MYLAISLAFFGVLLAAVAIAVWSSIRRTEYRFPQWALWMLARYLTRVQWRANVPSELPLVSGQGMIVVSNHRSSIDPLFVQGCVRRPVHWMVAREFCEHPAFRWFLRTCEVIPVNRGGIDTQSTKTAIRMASQGEWVGMLPEGRINMTDEFMLPVRPGAVMVALKARVPILPCYLENSPYNRTTWSPLLMTARVRLVVGSPIDLSAYYDRAHEDGLVEQLALDVARAIARLAGRDDFQPRLAGRKWKPTDEELAAVANPSKSVKTKSEVRTEPLD